CPAAPLTSISERPSRKSARAVLPGKVSPRRHTVHPSTAAGGEKLHSCSAGEPGGSLSRLLQWNRVGGTRGERAHRLERSLGRHGCWRSPHPCEHALSVRAGSGGTARCSV